MINLTIQSTNFKDISVIDINTFAKINGSVNNETIVLPYSNYILDISTSTSSVSFNSFWTSISVVTQDGIMIFLLLLLIVIAFLCFKFVRRL
jgi:hypothetical protein